MNHEWWISAIGVLSFVMLVVSPLLMLAYTLLAPHEEQEVRAARLQARELGRLAKVTIGRRR